MNLWFYKGGWASKNVKAKLSGLDPDNVNSIAVIRHAALGDMLLTRPFLCELRRNFPKAKITLSLASNFTRGAPADLVDRIHTIYGTDKRDASIREQVSRARELGYHDIIFDLAATTRGFWVCALNKAKIKVGFPYRGILRRLLYDIAVFRSDFKFEAETLLDMLNSIGIKTRFPLEFQLPGEIMKRDRPYVIYFTSASVPQKCWSSTLYIELIKRMAVKYQDFDHLILEGASEWETIDKIMAQLQDVSNVYGIKRLGFEELVSIVKGSILLVSNDTGVRNLGISAEIRTVGIFFDQSPFHTTPFRYWPRYGEHDAVFTLDGSMPDVNAVYESASKLLSKAGSV